MTYYPIGDDVAVSSFPLATFEKISNNGVKTDVTEWPIIVMLRALTEAAQLELNKGVLVYLEGKARTHFFLKGVKVFITGILPEKFIRFGSAPEIIAGK